MRSDRHFGRSFRRVALSARELLGKGCPILWQTLDRTTCCRRQRGKHAKRHRWYAATGSWRGRLRGRSGHWVGVQGRFLSKWLINTQKFSAPRLARSQATGRPLGPRLRWCTLGRAGDCWAGCTIAMGCRHSLLRNYKEFVECCASPSLPCMNPRP